MKALRNNEEGIGKTGVISGTVLWKGRLGDPHYCNKKKRHKPYPSFPFQTGESRQRVKKQRGRSKHGSLKSAVSPVGSHDGDPFGGHLHGRGARRGGLGPERAGGLAVLAAAADTVKLEGHAGEQQHHLAQDDANRQGQRHHKVRGQVEAVGVLLERPLPAEQQAVEGGNEQRDVAQRGLQGRGRLCVTFVTCAVVVHLNGCVFFSHCVQYLNEAELPPVEGAVYGWDGGDGQEGEEPQAHDPEGEVHFHPPHFLLVPGVLHIGVDLQTTQRAGWEALPKTINQVLTVSETFV